MDCFLAAVRVLRETVAGQLPAAFEHRWIQACVGDPEVAGRSATCSMATGEDHRPWRRWILPMEDDALV